MERLTSEEMLVRCDNISDDLKRFSEDRPRLLLEFLARIVDRIAANSCTDAYRWRDGRGFVIVEGLPSTREEYMNKAKLLRDRTTTPEQFKADYGNLGGEIDRAIYATTFFIGSQCVSCRHYHPNHHTNDSHGACSGFRDAAHAASMVAYFAANLAYDGFFLSYPMKDNQRDLPLPPRYANQKERDQQIKDVISLRQTKREPDEYFKYGDSR